MTGPTVTDLHGEFERALQRGAVPEAVEYAVRIEEADTPPAKLASQLESALKTENDGQAKTLLGALKRRHDTLAASEDALVERATVARNRNPTDDDIVGPLTEYVNAASGVSGARATATMQVTMFLYVGEGERTAADRENAIEAVSKLVEAERQAAKAAETARGVLDDLTLPAKIAVLALQPDSSSFHVDGSETVAATVGNVGDERATGVELTTSTDSGLSISPGTASVGTLDGGGRVSESLTVQASGTGEYAVTVSVESENAGDDRARETVTAVERVRSFAAAFDENDNGLLDTEEIQRAVEHYVDEKPVPATSAEGGRTLATEDIRRLVVTWANDRPV